MLDYSELHSLVLLDRSFDFDSPAVDTLYYLASPHDGPSQLDLPVVVSSGDLVVVDDLNLVRGGECTVATVAESMVVAGTAFPKESSHWKEPSLPSLDRSHDQSFYHQMNRQCYN